MQKEITFNEVPSVLATLVKEVKNLSSKLDDIMISHPVETANKRKILKTAQVCSLLGVTQITVYRMIKRGELTAYKRGKDLFFFEDEVMESLKDGKQIAWDNFDMNLYQDSHVV